ncbi:hypothetical protein [Telmatospirillum siberiense]|nr:hypothetical protein [Telmatospirillum siberiense]
MGQKAEGLRMNIGTGPADIGHRLVSGFEIQNVYNIILGAPFGD